MSNERGKPIYLTNGERRLVIEACNAAIKTWEAIMEAAEPVHEEMSNKAIGTLRRRQYRRIIRECADECLALLHDLATRYPLA